MSQISYRGNLSSAIFPMSLAQAGRSVIVPGPDNNYDRRVDPEGEQKDAGIPQAIYLENVIPTANGYQSVGSVTKLPITAIGVDETRVILKVDSPVVTTAGGERIGLYLAFVNNGTVLCNYTDLSSTWQLATSSGPDPWPPAAVNPSKKADVSIATIRGVTYVVSNSTWYEVQITGGTPVVNLLDVTASVVGITAGHSLHICSSYNYLIVLDRTDNAVYWSSTTTPLSFTPSLVTGAGSAVPNAMNTKPLFLIESPKGFFIYCVGGIVSAVYTGNSRYPWKFTPVADAGSYSIAENVAASPTSGEHFSIDDSNKIYVISHEAAQIIAPEATDWLCRIKTTDRYNQATDTFSTVQYVSSTVKFSRIHDVMERYIAVSYSITHPDSGGYEGCVIYDRVFKRYGVIKYAHNYILSEDDNLYFVKSVNSDDTQVREILFDIYAKDYYANAEFSAVLALGKFQYVRSQLLQLNEIEIESVQSADLITPQDFDLKILPSLDGKNFNSAITPTVDATRTAGTLVSYKTRNTAKNFTLVLKGAFDLSSVGLNFHIAGRR